LPGFAEDQIRLLTGKAIPMNSCKRYPMNLFGKAIVLLAMVHWRWFKVDGPSGELTTNGGLNGESAF
jgi:hypothetical protein